MTQPDHDFDKRLDQALNRNELDLRNGQVVDKTDGKDDSMSGLGFGMRIGVEFAAGTVVGFGLGYGIDRFFDTTPWFLLIFTLLGFGAGMLNVYRLVNNIDEGIGIHRQHGKSQEIHPENHREIQAKDASHNP